MATISDGLRNRPARAGLGRRPLLRAWYALVSVRVANALLAGIGVAGLVGILVEQFGSATLRDPALVERALQRTRERYGPLLAPVLEQLDLHRVFTSWWFTALVALFAVSVAGNTLMRLPRIVRDVRRPPVRRGRAFFRSSVPARTGPLEGLDGGALPGLLRETGYRVRTEHQDETTHLVAERNRFTPLASLVGHAALLLFIVGMGVITPRLGVETAIKVPVGEGRPTGFPDDPATLLVVNEGFVAEWNEAGSATDYRATLAVYRSGELLDRKEVRVNDPFSVGGWALHENAFGPAVELDVRNAEGLILYSGPVLLDGQLAGKPEGLLRIPGGDLSLELLLEKGDGDVAQLTVIGARPGARPGDPPVTEFGATLGTGDGYFVPDEGIGVEFRAPSSYVVLIAKRDPGQGLIWLGAVLMVGAMSVSLLFPRRRVWARYDTSTLRLAVVGGDPFPEREVDRLLSALPRVGAEPSVGQRGELPSQGILDPRALRQSPEAGLGAVEPAAGRVVAGVDEGGVHVTAVHPDGR